MKRFTWYLTMILTLSIIISTVDIFAKGSRSSTRSSTKSSFKSSTPKPKSKPVVKSIERSKKSSTFKKKESTTKAVTTQKTGIDNKLSKKSATGKQTYKTKKEAQAAYRKSLPDNSYKVQPTVRPSHIPEYTTYNGVRTNTVFVNGRYGTYRNGSFYAYDDDDFLVSDASMLAAGIMIGSAMDNQPRVTKTTIVHRDATNSFDVFVTIIWICIICGIAGIIIMLIIKKSRD